MNLIEALEAKGIEYHENQSRENELWLCCPFCTEEGTSPDTRFRLSVNIETGWFHCFNCNKGSKTAEYTWRELQRVLNTGELQAASMQGKKRRRKRVKVELPADFQLIAISGEREHWHQKAYLYLKKRGVQDWQIEQMGIGFSLVEMFRYRIVIPVYYDDKLKGLVGRAFVKGMEPPYLNSIGEKVLYHAVGEKDATTGVLTEGVFDALRVAAAIRKGSVVSKDLGSLASDAILGSSLTELQMSQLSQYERIISWFDADEAGVKATIKLNKYLQKVGKPHWVVPVAAGDPDPSDYSVSGIWQMLRQATPFTEELAMRMRMAVITIE